MKIKYKLFILFVLITAITMSVAGWVHINDLKNLFENQVQNNLQHDKKRANKYIEEIKEDLRSMVFTIAKDGNVISSLNLISKLKIPKTTLKRLSIRKKRSYSTMQSSG